MASEITFTREGIANLLHTGRFTVPKYQREFKWEEDHVRELFEDIENALEEEEPEYFLGSIVISSSDPERPEIVDGQQRLATISILMAAIRDYYDSSGDEETARYVEKEYLFEKDPVSKEITPRLKLSEADNEFFEKAILSKAGTPERDFEASQRSHERMKATRERAIGYVDKMVSSGNKIDAQIFKRVNYLSKISPGHSCTCA